MVDSLQEVKPSVYENIDQEDILKSVTLLDIFSKTFCRYRADYVRFGDLKFRCDEECPFLKNTGTCIVKEFKCKYAPKYKNFGCFIG